MEESGLSAIVEYVFHQKQQLGCLRVRDGLIVLEAMYFADEIRAAKGIAPKRSSKVDKKELEMAQTLIDRFTSRFDHSKYEDKYRKRLLKIVKQKSRGEEIHAPARDKQEAQPDLLEALRASVDAAKGAKNGRSKARRSTRAKAKTRSVAVELRADRCDRALGGLLLALGFAQRSLGYL